VTSGLGADQPPPGDRGAVSCLAEMFYRPGEAFRTLAQTPFWFVAVLVSLALAVAAQLVVQPRIDMETSIRRMLAERSATADMPPEQVDRIVERAAHPGAGIRALRAVGYVTQPLIFVFGVAALYYLGLVALGSEATYLHALSMSVHASLPAGLCRCVVFSTVVLRRRAVLLEELPNLVKSHVGVLLPAGAPKHVLALASTLDAFNVWQWALLVLGLTTVGKVRRGPAIGIVATVWGIWLIVKLGLASLGIVI
jgi:hypothetical protein